MQNNIQQNKIILQECQNKLSPTQSSCVSYIVLPPALDGNKEVLLRIELS